MARTGRPKVERVKVRCAGCGKEIERYSWQVANSKTGRFLCSWECRCRVGTKPRRKQLVTCRTCGKVFYPVSGCKGIYCSRACHNIGQTKRVEQICPICGKTFEVKPSLTRDRIVRRGNRQYVQHARKYCSKECEGRARWKRPQKRMHNGKPVLLDPAGYVKVWEPSRPPRRRWVLEHRLVMEGLIGRLLRAGEHVHHLNRDKADNRPENLVLIGASDHAVVTNRLTQERIDADQEELKRYRQLYGPLPPTED